MSCASEREIHRKKEPSAFAFEGDTFKGETINMFQSQQPKEHDNPKQYRTLGPKGSNTLIKRTHYTPSIILKRVQSINLVYVKETSNLVEFAKLFPSP